MNGVAEKNAYNKEQSQMSHKHLNKQLDEVIKHWEHKRPERESKSPYHQSLDKKWNTAKKKLKPPVDMEAILALEEKLWNS
jgi:hypothetical protein